MITAMPDRLRPVTERRPAFVKLPLAANDQFVCPDSRTRCPSWCGQGGAGEALAVSQSEEFQLRLGKLGAREATWTVARGGRRRTVVDGDNLRRVHIQHAGKPFV